MKDLNTIKNEFTIVSSISNDLKFFILHLDCNGIKFLIKELNIFLRKDILDLTDYLQDVPVTNAINTSLILKLEEFGNKENYITINYSTGSNMAYLLLNGFGAQELREDLFCLLKSLQSQEVESDIYMTPDLGGEGLNDLIIIPNTKAIKVMKIYGQR